MFNSVSPIHWTGPNETICNGTMTILKTILTRVKEYVRHLSDLFWWILTGRTTGFLLSFRGEVGKRTKEDVRRNYTWQAQEKVRTVT